MTDREKACILVVEGDVLVRNLVSTVLNNDGYLVMAAANLAEAMELSRTFPDEVRVVIARDPEVPRQLAAGRPGAQAVLISDEIFSELRAIVHELAPHAYHQQSAHLPRGLREAIQRAMGGAGLT